MNAAGERKGRAEEMGCDDDFSDLNGSQWVTPRQPLLRGTMRQSLLDAGALVEMDIKAEDWDHYRQVSLINAMMPLGRLICNLR